MNKQTAQYAPIHSPVSKAALALPYAFAGMILSIVATMPFVG